MIRRPPRSTRTYTLFPYTTLFRSVELRQRYAKTYDDTLSKYPFIKINKIEGRTISYYIQVFEFLPEIAGISRETFLEAVRAELEVVSGRENEGVPIYEGYVKPLYLIPMFQKRIAYKTEGYGFKDTIEYKKGICPTVEKLQEERLWNHDFTRSALDENDIQDVLNAYVKVCENIDELKA